MHGQNHFIFECVMLPLFYFLFYTSEILILRFLLPFCGTLPPEIYRGQPGLYNRGTITGRKDRPSEAEEPQICDIYIYIYIYIYTRIHTHKSIRAIRVCIYIYIYMCTHTLLWRSVFHGFPDVVFPCSLRDLLFFLPSPGPLCVCIYSLAIFFSPSSSSVPTI